MLIICQNYRATDGRQGSVNDNVNKQVHAFRVIRYALFGEVRFVLARNMMRPLDIRS